MDKTTREKLLEQGCQAIEAVFVWGAQRCHAQSVELVEAQDTGDLIPVCAQHHEDYEKWLESQENDEDAADQIP